VVHIRNDLVHGGGQRGTSGLLVIRLEVGVDPIRDLGAGMAQPAGHGHGGDASGDEAGAEVVPQRVRRDGDPDGAFDAIEDVSGDGSRC
jgi:hypothetical protein